MPKINVYLPDDLAEAVKAANIPVSAVCQRALEQAVRRVTAIREVAMGDLEDRDATELLGQCTQRTRQVLKLAVERSRAAGAPGVGTEHLLGALVAEGTNLALHVLRAIDIDPARIEEALATHGGNGGAAAAPDSGVPDGARRFTPDAANALELAVTEATALGHNYVGCEHLLLGLIAEPDGAGGRILRGLGAEMRLTRRAVTAALAGYVHLRAQTGATAAASPGAGAAVAAAVRRELAPLLERLERLERHVGLPVADPGDPA